IAGASYILIVQTALPRLIRHGFKRELKVLPEHPSFRARGRYMLGGDRRSFRDYPDEVAPSRSESTSTSEHHRNRRRSISITPEIGDDIVRRKYQVSKTATNVGDGTDVNEFSEGIAAAEEGTSGTAAGLVSPVDINPINSSADEEGGTTVVGLDATFIPDVGNNGCTTVLDAVGGFVAWPKNQVVLDPKATPPSTIQMITGENKTAPKVQTKRKNVYVSSDAMQKEAKMRISVLIGTFSWYQSGLIYNAKENAFANDNASNNCTKNATTNVVNDEDLPQLLDSRGVIKCTTTRAMWSGLTISHEGPSETKDTKIATLRLKFKAFKALKSEKVQQTYTRLNILLNDLENKDVKIPQDIDLDVEEDTKSSKEYLIKVVSKQKNHKRLVAESFDYDEESLSSEYKGTTRVKAFMAIAEDELAVGKIDARSRKKRVLDYTKLDFHYVEDQRKNLLNKFNSLKQELSSFTKLNMDNESMKDEVSDLRKFIKKWTSSKVSLDQLLSEQVPSNIIYALGRRGKWKVINSIKDIVFIKAEDSPIQKSPQYASNNESDNDNQEPLPPLLKLSGAEPIGTSSGVISTTDLTQTSIVSNKTKQVADKNYMIKSVKKKAQTKTLGVPEPKLEKKANSTTKELLLTLMKEVKGLKEQIKP
ncbi:hypothetical protein Tco_0623037, partial [Tanacetum coccineum]